MLVHEIGQHFMLPSFDTLLMFFLQIFWWSHCLYIFYWILLILHAPNFWKWFIVPCILFIIEKLYRFGNSMSQKGKTWVTTGVILPSKVGIITEFCTILQNS